MSEFKVFTEKYIELMLLGMMVVAVHSEIKIATLTRDKIPGVKCVVVDAWNELFSKNYTVADWERDDHFVVVDNFETECITFLTLIDGETVVGCGGIRQLSADTCELKRMWFLKAYRGLGWGSTMLTQLLHIAREHGCKYIRLEVWIPEKQTQAVAFYHKFGFYEIEPYCESRLGALFMEKKLSLL